MSTISSIGHMPVTAVMADEIVRVAADATVREVAETLQRAQVGIAVVMEGAELIGVVSERDVMNAVADGCDLGVTRARALASSSVVWADAAANVAEVANEMMERYVRHVLVEEAGELVGVVSARDLLGVFASAEPAGDDDIDDELDADDAGDSDAGGPW